MVFKLNFLFDSFIMKQQSKPKQKQKQKSTNNKTNKRNNNLPTYTLQLY